MKIKTITITMAGAVCASLLAVSAAHAQNLFVGSYGNGSIEEISGGTTTTFANGFSYPNAVAFNSAGDVFAADSGGYQTIYEYPPSGGTATVFASNLNDPFGMAFNAAGNLFVANAGNNSILEFGPSGGTPTLIPTTNLYEPDAIAFDSAGNLYIANLANDAAGQGYITKITPGGVQTVFAANLNAPAGLAFNSAGDLFVSEGNNNDTIIEVTPGGNESPFATGLDQPIGLAFDSAGDLWVADGGVLDSSGNITELDADGNVLSVNTSIPKPISLAFQGETLPVPEPSEYALFGLGLAALVLRATKKAARA